MSLHTSQLIYEAAIDKLANIDKSKALKYGLGAAGLAGALGAGAYGYFNPEAHAAIANAYNQGVNAASTKYDELKTYLRSLGQGKEEAQEQTDTTSPLSGANINMMRALGSPSLDPSGQGETLERLKSALPKSGMNPLSAARASGASGF